MIAERVARPGAGRLARAPAAIGLIALVLGAACAPAVLPTRFYVLAATPPPSSPGPTRDLAIGVGPVTLPAYLDRPQIVTRTSADEIELADFDQWGEPLRQAALRILAENLAARIPTDRVAVFPWRGSRAVQYQVAVDIARFEGAPGGDAVLRARWRLLDGSGRELAVRATAITEATGTSGYAPLVAALSRTMATLSAEIATAIP